MRFDFGALLALIALALGWIALRRIAALSDRVATLEAALRNGAPAEPAETEDPPEVPNDTDPVPPSTVWSPAVARPRMAPVIVWLRANWIYPVAGVALVMAAIYLVQYSIDQGLLSPALRIALTLALGGALIAGAEVLRRRWGETGAPLVAATLGGAGIVALMVAVLAAFHLYQMLGQAAALLGLALIALGAMALGWVMGPLLAALGVLAGAAAPFLLGKGGTPTDLLYGYFALVALLGMGIDAYRRWGWVSALAVVAPLAGGVLAQIGGAGAPGLAALAVGVALLASALPSGTLQPSAQGPAPWQRGASAPTRIAALAVGLGVAILVLRLPAVPGVLGAGVLAVLMPLWTARAPALGALSALAAAGLPAAVAYSLIGTPRMLALGLLFTPWLAQVTLGLAVAAGAAMLWRSETSTGRARDLWALGALATPGVTLIAVELMWNPSGVIGLFNWAATAMALAAGYCAVALWAARVDGGQGLRLGAAAAASFAAIALALMLMLSASALTLALAVLMIAAAALDRRMALPELGAILGLGTMALSWRILIDPGLGWLMDPFTAPLDVWLALLASVLGPLIALRLGEGLPAAPARTWGRIITETGLMGLIPAVLAIVFMRFFEESVKLHALMGIEGAVLIAAAKVQLTRAASLPGARVMQLLRRALALIAGLAAALCLALGATLFSPVFGGWFAEPVQGVAILNDLALAYGLPGAVLWVVLAGASGRPAQIGRALAGLWLAQWAALVIRHLWHGGTGMAQTQGVFQGELYAYTVALLVAGAAAMGLALRLQDAGWRRIGLGVIGLAAIKGFLIDASGLEGLMRAGAFLGLGLSLAGLAWANGWIAGRGVELQDKKD